MRKKKRHPKDKLNAAGETPILLERFGDIQQNEVEIYHSPFDTAPWNINKDFEAVDIKYLKL